MRNATWTALLLASAGLAMLPRGAFGAEPVFERKTPRDHDQIIHGGQGVTDRSAVAGVCSLLLPGVGQAINRNKPEKIIVHAVLGLLSFVAVFNPVGLVFGIFHVWSGWDALIDRTGGYLGGTVLNLANEGWLETTSGMVPDAGGIA